MMTTREECCRRSIIEWDMEELLKGYTEKMWEIHKGLDEEEGEQEATARQMAAGRAIWEPVICDPLARFLAGGTHLRRFHSLVAAAAEASAEAPLRGLILAVRTLWFDARIAEAIASLKSASSSVVQIVFLGAGMDARAYRLECLAGCHVYEVDLPRLVEAKEALLGETEKPAEISAKLARIAADLADDQWSQKLTQAGFKWDRTVATLWVAEGLLYYLQEVAARALLRRIASFSAVGSRLLADFLHLIDGEEQPPPAFSSASAPIHTTSHDPAQLLPSLGFDSQVHVSQLGDPDTRFDQLLGSLSDFAHLLDRGLIPSSPRLLLLQCSVPSPPPPTAS